MSEAKIPPLPTIDELTSTQFESLGWVRRNLVFPVPNVDDPLQPVDGAVLSQRSADLKRVGVSCGSRTRRRHSFANLHGVEAFHEESCTPLWVCAYCPQVHVFLNTDKALRHLNREHKLVDRSRLAKKRKIEEAAEGPKVAPEEVVGGSFSVRTITLNLALAAIEQFWTPASTEAPHVRNLLGMIPGWPSRLDDRTVENAIAEIYLSVLAPIKRDFEARRRLGHGKPFLSVSLNLWTDKTSRKNILGLRTFYVDEEWQCKSHLLAVRELCPPAWLLATERFSETVLMWTLRVLDSFGLKRTDIVAATTDAGGDFRRCFDVVLNHEAKGFTGWIWCPAHLLNCVLKSATAKTLSDLFGELQKVCEHVNTCAVSSAVLSEVQADLSCVPLKLRKSAPQRWSSWTSALERIISQWAYVEEAFNVRGLIFPLSNTKRELESVLATLRPVVDMIRRCQGGMSLPETSFRMARLRSKLASECDTDVGAAGALRSQLLFGFDQRFTKLYMCDERSWTADMAAALHPAMKDLPHTRALFEDHRALGTRRNAKVTHAWILEETWLRIGKMATERLKSASQGHSVLHKMFAHAARQVTRGAARHHPGDDDGGDSADEDFARMTRDPSNAEEIVRAEIARFRLREPKRVKLNGRDVPKDKRFDMLYLWKRLDFYPNLKRVAKDIYSASAASASSVATECDFGMAGEDLRAKRFSLGGPLFEAIVYLRQDLAALPQAHEVHVRDAQAVRRLPQAPGYDDLDHIHLERDASDDGENIDDDLLSAEELRNEEDEELVRGFTIGMDGEGRRQLPFLQKEDYYRLLP